MNLPATLAAARARAYRCLAPTVAVPGAGAHILPRARPAGRCAAAVSRGDRRRARLVPPPPIAALGGGTRRGLHVAPPGKDRNVSDKTPDTLRAQLQRRRRVILETSRGARAARGRRVRGLPRLRAGDRSPAARGAAVRAVLHRVRGAARADARDGRGGAPESLERGDTRPAEPAARSGAASSGSAAPSLATRFGNAKKPARAGLRRPARAPLRVSRSSAP